MSSDPSSQWLFSLDALDNTPSSCSREKELYDRARGVEFLFRLGSSLQLLVLQLRSMPQKIANDRERSPTSAMCTAATWFHRFYMRYSIDEFHRQVKRLNSGPLFLY